MRNTGWLLAIILLLLTAGAAYSQEQSWVISQVTILVDGKAAEPGLRNLVNLQPGKAYSDYQVDQSLKQLMQTGFFSRAEVYFSRFPAQELTYVLTRNIVIRNIRISGGRDLRSRISEELVFLKEGGILSENARDKAIKEIEKILTDEGLFLPQVNFEIKRIGDSNLADVTIQLPEWKRLTVRGISFKEQNIIPEDRLTRLLGLKPGDYYVPRKLANGLDRIKRAFNKQGYKWAEVKLSREEVDQQKGIVDLSLDIEPSVKITVNLVGTKISPKVVQPVWEQKVFEEWALSEGEAILLKKLRKKGYLLATVRSRINRAENELQVTYEAHQGPKLKIKPVQFRGLNAFNEKELKKVLGIGEKLPLFPYLNGQEIFELPENIRLFYEKQGFSQTRVNLNFIRQDDSATPVFFIEEGPRQTVRSLEIQGATAISLEEIVKLLDSRPGQAYYKPKLQRDLEKINLLYLNRGFRGTQIELDASPDRENNMDVIIRIAEGKRVKIDNIFITGNHLTDRDIIQREVRFKPGQWAEYDRLLETKRGLDSLGVFSEVKLEELPASDDTINLSIQVREGEQNFAGIGLGIETREEVKSMVLWQNELRPRITAEYIRYNAFGNASQLSLVGQFSLVEKRLVASWQLPYFFGLRMRTYFSGYLEKEDRTSFSYERRGLSLSTMRDLPAKFSLLLAAGALRTKLTNLAISESEVERERLPYSMAYGSTTFIHDRRDDTFNPRKGYFFSLALERAYPLLHTESNFFKLFAKFQYFYPLASGLNFHTILRYGLASGTVPIPERFFAGGSNSFRGDGFEMLGPKDPESGLPLGGKTIFLLNMEAKFRLFKKLPNLEAAVFYDVGNVFPEIKEFNFLELSQAVGAGLRFRTPLGPIRFDMGWNLNPPEKTWKPLFFLTIGNMF
jgi:outer membrane protein assembly complex protein YaeT